MAQAETETGDGPHSGGMVFEKPVVGWNKEKVCMMDKSLNEHTNFCARDVDLKISTAASFCACEQYIQKFIPLLDIRATAYVRKDSTKKGNKVLCLGL